MEIVLIIALVLAVASIGAAAGWFLAFWLVVSLTAVCFATVIWLRIPTGSTEGSWIGMLQIPVVIFLVAMLSAHAISSGALAGMGVSPDWQSIKKFFFK